MFDQFTFGLIIGFAAAGATAIMADKGAQALLGGIYDLVHNNG